MTDAATSSRERRRGRQRQQRAGGVAALGPRVLVAVGELASTRGSEVELAQGRERLEAECHMLTFERPDPDGSPEPAQLLCAVITSEDWDVNSQGPVTLTANGSSFELDPRAQLQAALGALVRRDLAPLDGRTRNRISDFMARACASALAGAGGLRVSERLFSLRQALRERLPVHANQPEHPMGLYADRLLAIDERSYYLRGWMRDEASRAVRLTAVSPEGARMDLLDRLYRFPRPDVLDFYSGLGRATDTRLGMLSFFDLGVPSMEPAGWILEMEEGDGAAIEVAIPPVVRDPEVVRNTILEDALRERQLDRRLMVDNVKPALTLMQERLEQTVRVRAVNQYGVGPESPDVSIIVPLYQHIEHVEMQMAEFGDDPQLRDADLIYVLDSPEQADALDFTAGQLEQIYGIPFRTVVLEHNVGFAGANNAGFGLARGRLLLLLNSDVLPARPGWLRAMAEFYDQTPGIGALGPKLLYEDDSIQHAGMCFHQPPGSPDWLDAHFFKGMHRTLPEANVARPVPAVSGACLMIAADLYRRLPLRGIYVRGDYEDFDLCMRLTEAGLENWYVPSAELYHLEAQSYTSQLRGPTNRYNMWLHTHLWSDTIEQLMSSDRYRPTGDLRPT